MSRKCCHQNYCCPMECEYNNCCRRSCCNYDYNNCGYGCRRGYGSGSGLIWLLLLLFFGLR